MCGLPGCNGYRAIAAEVQAILQFGAFLKAIKLLDAFNGRLHLAWEDTCWQDAGTFMRLNAQARRVYL